MKFSGLLKIRITKNYVLIITFMFINAVTVEANRRRGKGIFFVPGRISEGAASQDLDIFAKPPNDLYSLGPMLKTINSSRHNPMDVLSVTDANVFKRKEENIVRENNLIAGANMTREEYFLGYSNNIFESYTKYIKQVSPKYYASNDISGQKRRKRSVLHLYNMVLCATGCNPLSYKGYGCYCGFLGSGYVVDGIDRCCKIHDWCYDTAGCPMFLEYFIPYLWKCYNHHYPLCAIDHGEFGGPGSCAQKLCECDRQLAQCLRMYPCPSSKALCTSSPWRLLQNLFMN